MVDRTAMMVKIARKVMAPIQRRVQLMVSRAVVNLVKETGLMQGVQVTILADEVADDVENFQAYGFTSSPLPGAEAIVVSIGGSRGHPVAVVVADRRTRFKGPGGTGMALGEVAAYTDKGQRVHLKIDGSMALVPVLTGTVDLGSDAPVEFVALATKVLTELAAIKTAFDAHVHSGVTAGGASSGAPTVPMPTPTAPAATKVRGF